MNRFTLRASCAAAAMLAAGCASITDGTEQTIIVQVQPREAQCTLTREGVELGTGRGTTQTFTVSKGARDIIVACSAPGHDPKTTRLVSTTQTGGVMSVLFLDFGITDMVTGAMWKYPSGTSIVLQPIQAAAAPVAASVAAAQPVGTAAVQSAAAPAGEIGQESHQIERMPEVQACTAGRPIARLVGKAPGVESYSVTCANGDLLAIRCEMRSCRVLK
jgi:hypothetical protein